MDRTRINQFTDAAFLEISSDSGFTEPLVDLVQRSGSMRFQFSMRTEQARDMARALLAHADEAERCAASASRDAVEVML